MSTVNTLLANKFATGLLDRHLARTGYDSQQTDEPREADQPANLWHPADGAGGRDFGAHGRFDDTARHSSPQMWASQHVRSLTAAGAALAAAATALAWRALRLTR